MAERSITLEFDLKQKGSAEDDLRKTKDEAKETAKALDQVAASAKKANEELLKMRNAQAGGGSTVGGGGVKTPVGSAAGGGSAAAKGGSHGAGGISTGHSTPGLKLPTGAGGIGGGPSGAGAAAARGAAGAAAGGTGTGAALAATRMAAAGPVGAIAAAVYVAYNKLVDAAEKAAKALEITGDKAMTESQKRRALFEEFVPGGEKLVRFGDAITGVTSALKENERALQRQQTITQHIANLRQRSSTGAAEVAGAEGTAVGMRFNKLGAWQGGSFDRSTAEGQIGSADYARRQGAADSVTRAKQERDAAGFAANSQAGREAEARARLKQAEAEEMAASRDLAKRQAAENGTPDKAGKRDKAGVDEAAKRLQDRAQNTLNAQKQLQTEIERSKEKQVTLAEKESAIRKAQIEQSKAELEILKSKEARMSEMQKNVGGMNTGQFEMAKGAAAFIKANGIENASSEVIDLARSVAPKMVDKMAEDRGAGRAQELAALGIDDYQSDFKAGSDSLKEVRAKVDSVEASIRVDVQLDAEKLAQKTAEVLGASLASLIESIKAEMLSELAKVRGEQTARNNANY